MSNYLRVARPTDQLDDIVEMYRRGLDLEIVGSFRDHDGYDGVILAGPNPSWEIEFTREKGLAAPRCSSPEHLLVIYEADGVVWGSRCEAMITAGFVALASANPYWDERGRTFEDPEGYRVVIQNDVAPGRRAATESGPSSESG